MQTDLKRGNARSSRGCLASADAPIRETLTPRSGTASLCNPGGEKCSSLLPKLRIAWVGWLCRTGSGARGEGGQRFHEPAFSALHPGCRGPTPVARRAGVPASPPIRQDSRRVHAHHTSHRSATASPSIAEHVQHRLHLPNRLTPSFGVVLAEPFQVHTLPPHGRQLHHLRQGGRPRLRPESHEPK